MTVFHNFPIFHGGVATRSANISKNNDEFFPSVGLSLLYYIFIILKNLWLGNLVQSFSTEFCTLGKECRAFLIETAGRAVLRDGQPRTK
jgi:hypothetical protein